jgi:hypothetical protein
MPVVSFVSEDGGSRGKQSRSEKKSRKAIQKLGMKPLPGVMRVTIKKSKNVSCAYGNMLCTGMGLLLLQTRVVAPVRAAHGRW